MERCSFSLNGCDNPAATQNPALGHCNMKDTISSGLDLLATGLRPYVADRAASMACDARILADIEHGDAQFLLVLMWDRWNDMFRQDLSFVERSLISELRDSVRTAGPKECRDCGKIIYTIECPYCRPAALRAEADPAMALSQPLSGLRIVQKLTSSLEPRRAAAAKARSK